MILDSMQHAARYAQTASGMAEMFVALEKCAQSEWKPGRVEVDGEHMFMNVCEYETRPRDERSRMEGHRRYADVMYMVEGEETIYVCPTESLAVEHAYDPAADVLLAAFEPKATPVSLRAGQFVVLFPQDAHCPGCQTEQSQSVKKIIGKLELI